MQIVHRLGDFITGGENLIVHGCNAQGGMGAGAARAVRISYPCAFMAYRETYLSRGLKLGEVVWAIDVGPASRMIIGNAITQEFYGSDGRRYVSYEAIQAAIREVDALVARTQRPTAEDGIDIHGITPVTKAAMPMIGAGLGGGDWLKIAAIIEQESQHFTPIVYRLA